MWSLRRKIVNIASESLIEEKLLILYYEGKCKGQTVMICSLLYIPKYNV
jgi:hypothetical protein